MDDMIFIKIGIYISDSRMCRDFFMSGKIGEL
jgi:hypothetical protein